MRLLLALLAVLLLAPAPAHGATRWLCSPMTQGDACDVGLATTHFGPTGERLGVERPRPGRRRVDCFYVYPTVSDQPTTLANRRIDPEIRSIALYQAARFGQECRVFAPVYRQRTIAGLTRGARGIVAARAYADVREAWRTYLARHNDGRGVVLLGHSQGTYVLRELIRREIDDGSRVHRRVVSAILLGGNVVEGEFNGFRPCRTPRQLRCVVAFATYGETPPPDALFGRSGIPGARAVCTNPARLRGGPATVDAIYPSEPFAPGTLIAAGIQLLGVTQPRAATPWVAVNDAYRAQCRRSGDVRYLELTPLRGAPAFRPSPTAQWGLHLVDANAAMGDLLALVRRQAAAFARTRRR